MCSIEVSVLFYPIKASHLVIKFYHTYAIIGIQWDLIIWPLAVRESLIYLYYKVVFMPFHVQDLISHFDDPLQYLNGRQIRKHIVSDWFHKNVNLYPNLFF
jgi:hypothetical protein